MEAQGLCAAAWSQAHGQICPSSGLLARTAPQTLLGQLLLWAMAVVAERLARAAASRCERTARDDSGQMCLAVSSESLLEIQVEITQEKPAGRRRKLSKALACHPLSAALLPPAPPRTVPLYRIDTLPVALSLCSSMGVCLAAWKQATESLALRVEGRTSGGIPTVTTVVAASTAGGSAGARPSGQTETSSLVAREGDSAPGARRRLRRDQYQSMPHDDLVDLVCLRDNQL